MANKTRKVFNPTLWVLGVLKWSPKWKDPETNEPGSWFYAHGNNAGWNATDVTEGKMKCTFVRVNQQKREDAKEKDSFMLQIHGGRDAGANLPQKAYFGIAEGSTVGKLMSVAEYEKASQNIEDISSDSVQIGADA